MSLRRKIVLSGLLLLPVVAHGQGTINGIPNQSMVGGASGISPSVVGDLLNFSTITGGLQDSGVLLSALATLASPTFTGIPAAPTAAPGTSTTQLSSTAFVTAAITAASVPIILSTTTSFGGSLISLGCTSQATVTVTGATTAMSCNISGAGSSPTNLQVQCFVSAANTVTPQACTSISLGVTPATTTYNIRVF